MSPNEAGSGGGGTGTSYPGGNGGGSSMGVGAGGGGRIAIFYNVITLPASNITANGGTSSNATYNGIAGTIFYHQE